MNMPYKIARRIALSLIVLALAIGAAVPASADSGKTTTSSCCGW